MVSTPVSVGVLPRSKEVVVSSTSTPVATDVEIDKALVCELCKGSFC